jgi:AraC-like DNA-binding protein
MFTVRIQNAHVERVPAPYTAVTVPVSGPLRFYLGSSGATFHPGSAHVLHTNSELDLRVGPPSGLFVATFDGDWIDNTALRLTDHEHYSDLLGDRRLDLESSTGRSFRLFLDFVWSEICRGGLFTRSETATREIEHTCVTLLILASEAESQQSRTNRDRGLSKEPLERAEEFIRAHLAEPFALDKLIEITGTSASTLLREFRKRYGMPPIQYLKHRRLEAARRELLSAERDQITVTDVALRYGFYHLGRFSGVYRETFGELPSETLKHQR